MTGVQTCALPILHFTIKTAKGSKGWSSGGNACLSPMWPGFKSRRRRHIWVEFVVGSLPCPERFFSGYSGFPVSPKTNTSKFQFDQESGGRRTTLRMSYLQITIYLFYSFKWTSSLISQVAKCRVRVCTDKRMYHYQQVNSYFR